MKKPLDQKRTFPKFRSYRIDEPVQMIWSQLYFKILGEHFVNSALDNNSWDIINGKTSNNKHD